MSFIRKRNSRKKPTWIHSPKYHVFDPYYTLYVQDVGYWLTRFFNLPLIIVIILWALFLFYDSILVNQAASHIVDFLGMSGEGTIEKFSWRKISDRDLVKLFLVMVLSLASLVVLIIKIFQRKRQSKGFLSIITEKPD